MSSHKLLQRQLKRIYGSQLPQDELFQSFIKLVNDSYNYNDSDRLLLERAMTLSSDELSNANKKLREETSNQKKLLDKLLEAITLLARNEDEIALIKELSKAESSYHLVNLADHLQVLAEEQRRTEKLLLLQDTFMTEAQKLASFGTWSYNLKTGDTDWSANLTHIFDRESFLGFDLYNYTQLVLEEEKAEVENALSFFFINGLTTLTHRIVDSSQNVKWIEASFKMMYDDKGEPTTILGTALDITRRKQAENALEYKIQELEEATSFLDTLIEEIPIAIYVKEGTSLQIIKANQVARNTIKLLTGNDILSKNSCEIFSKEKMQEYEIQEKEVLTSKRIMIIPEDKFHADTANEIIFKTQKVPVLDQAGCVKYIIVISEDITERKRVENQIRAAARSAEEANRAKSAFLSSMSHELRTPLNAIIGFSQILQRDTSIPAQQRSYVETMYRSGNHLLAMINDVLDISKIEAGKFDLAFEPFSLREITFDIESMFGLKAKEKGLNLLIRTQALLPATLYSDSKRIQQVLINLIGNAIKFTQKGFVELEISAESIPETSSYQLIFVVRDSGRGIPENQLRHIFEPFRQVKGLYSEGTGLGLAICQKIAEMLRGSISVTSQPGKGSEFTFSLEVESAYDNRYEPEEEFRPVLGILGTKKWRVLIVDDIANNRTVVRAFLESLGFECIEADNGYDAVMMAELFKPDVIFMDIMMPGMSGDTAFQQIRQNSALDFIKIIALTASGSAAKKEELLTMGFDDYITKPYREKWLIQTLDKIAGVPFRYKPTSEESKQQHQEDEMSHYVDWLLNQTSSFRNAFIELCDIQDFEHITELLNSLNSDSTEVQELLRYANSDDNLFFIELAERIANA